eukprot:scaffold12235_cov117-Isochrysis_galbana.AAC.2
MTVFKLELYAGSRSRCGIMPPLALARASLRPLVNANTSTSPSGWHSAVVQLESAAQGADAIRWRARAAAGEKRPPRA